MSRISRSLTPRSDEELMAAALTVVCRIAESAHATTVEKGSPSYAPVVLEITEAQWAEIQQIAREQRENRG